MMKTDEQWLISTMRTAIEHKYPIALLSGWRIRIYERDKSTKFTFYLDDFTEHIQETVVDLIFPYID
jgi:hypothetical protein